MAVSAGNKLVRIYHSPFSLEADVASEQKSADGVRHSVAADRKSGVFQPVLNFLGAEFRPLQPRRIVNMFTKAATLRQFAVRSQGDDRRATHRQTPGSGDPLGRTGSAKDRGQGGTDCRDQALGQIAEPTGQDGLIWPTTGRLENLRLTAVCLEAQGASEQLLGSPYSHPLVPIRVFFLRSDS